MIVWKLDEVLRVKGIKGRELARRMAIGENYLSRVRHEVPDRLSLSLLDGLCRELGCTIADLLEYQGTAAPAPAAPKAKSAPRKQAKAPAPEVAPVAELEEDFEAIVASALGEALTEEPPARSVALVLPRPRWEREVAAERAAEEGQPGAVVRTNALGAKLNRLKQRRST